MTTIEAQQRKVERMQQQAQRRKEQAEKRRLSHSGGKPVGLPGLIEIIVNVVKAHIIRKVAVEVLVFILTALERWLATLGAKEEGRELLRLMAQPRGKEVLEEVVEAFV